MSFYNDLKKYENNVALIDEYGNKVTYSQLELFCNVVQEKFACGKNLVFCFCKNEISSVVGYLACLRSGNVPLLLSTDIDYELVVQLIEQYRPQYLINANKNILEQFSYKDIGKCLEYNLIKMEFENAPIYKDLALLLTTSGSTGSPKLVRQSYENVQSNAEAIAQYLELDENECPITTLPMNYTYGLSIINSHLLVGARIVLTENSLIKREFWELCKKQEVTSFGGVPYTYEILKKLKFFRMDLPSLRTMTQAGGKLRPELHKEFAEFAAQTNKKFIVMYGQTEATARMAYLPHNKSLEKYGSMGIAIPGGCLWLRNENGEEIKEPECVGELVYEGPNVTLGYAETREELSKGDERNGVLETGDMAKMDVDGYFYIVGRKKRFLKIYGNRVNLDEVEGILKKEFEIVDLVCTGMDDRLFVFVEEGNKIDTLSVKKFLSEKTKLNSNAFCVKFIPAIPKNDSGKIVYKMLEEYYD